MTKTFCIDIHEQQAHIDRFREMLDGDWTVKVRGYEVSDYHVGNILGIEHKSPPDFVGSIKKGRLFQQAYEVHEHFATAYIVVSGSLNDVFRARRGLGENSITAAVASLCGRYDVPVLFTGDDGREFYNIIAGIIDKKFDNKTIQYQPVRKAPSEDDVQRNLIKSLPGIGHERAGVILSAYGSPWKAFKNIEEWDDLHGIGTETVNKAKAAIGAPG